MSTAQQQAEEVLARFCKRNNIPMRKKTVKYVVLYKTALYKFDTTADALEFIGHRVEEGNEFDISYWLERT